MRVYAGLTKKVDILAEELKRRGGGAFFAALRGCIYLFLKLNICYSWIIISRYRFMEIALCYAGLRLVRLAV